MQQYIKQQTTLDLFGAQSQDFGLCLDLLYKTCDVLHDVEEEEQRRDEQKTVTIRERKWEQGEHHK